MENQNVQSDPNTPTADNPGKNPSKGLVALLLVLMTALVSGLVYFVVMLWPCAENGFSDEWIGREQKLILLVACVGAIGACIHMITSFIEFWGAQKLTKTWLPWYYMRPVIGAALALMFYFILRGGLLDWSKDQSTGKPEDCMPPFNLYGLLAICGMAGMFSRTATLKLKEVFDQLFKPKDENTSGTLTGKPAVTQAQAPQNLDNQNGSGNSGPEGNQNDNSAEEKDKE